ncbi:hypothetical protein H2204_009994 [Knufia peltigerae]|uniref:Amidohydrolase-related domain-containing protein n=1 Tax=Knufia peltigerae TaxID=1002370 RepID=A0AA39CVE1_9EURO|nr:hypothetical protein H2204_009994 [Knufia peltigerae]
MASSVLFKNATVVTMDEAVGVLEHCDVLIEGNIIKCVGCSLERPSAETVVIDGTNSILSPGFVDTHRHVWQQQLRTIAGDFTIFEYGANIRNKFGSCYTSHDVYLAELCGALESIDAGTTCLLDHSHIMNSPAHSNAAVAGLRASGIRGVFCYGAYPNPVFANPAVSDGSAEHRTDDWRREDAKRVREEHFASNGPDSLLRFGYAPTEMERTPLEQTIEEIRFGQSIGSALITGHVAMGPLDRGIHLVRSLDDQSLLDSRMLLSHGASLTPAELTALANSGASVSSTPSTELQMGMGLPVAFKAESHGCTASIGADITSNNPADMFDQMRLLLQCQRYVDAGDVPPCPQTLNRRCAQVLRMATVGGSKGMGLEALTGTITPGKRADMILTRCDSLRMTPVHDPVIALVMYAHSSDITHVLVDGAVLKSEGELQLPYLQRDGKEASLPKLLKDLRTSAEWILERSKLVAEAERAKSVREYFKHSST